MKRLKDLIYDYNDVFVAILIVMLAGAIIFWRINEIVAYPSYIAKQTAGEAVDEINLDDIDLSLTEVDDINENPQDIVTDPADGQDDIDIDAPTEVEFVTTKEVSFTVPAGVSGAKIASLLYEEELITSTQAFMTAVAEKNVETKLMAGTFKIPVGSTVGDIVDIITR